MCTGVHFRWPLHHGERWQKKTSGQSGVVIYSIRCETETLTTQIVGGLWQSAWLFIFAAVGVTHDPQSNEASAKVMIVS